MKGTRRVNMEKTALTGIIGDVIGLIADFLIAVFDKL